MSLHEENTIKRRLKRHDSWHCNYLDILVDSELRMQGNTLANKGPRQQCRFLLKHGWTIDEIVKEGKRQRKYIVKQMQGMAKPTKTKRR